MDEFGYDKTKNTEDFFQKVIAWKSSMGTTVKTSRRFVEMMQEKPKSLSVFEDTIIIDYDNSIIDVKDNIGEFLFFDKGSTSVLENK